MVADEGIIYWRTIIDKFIIVYMQNMWVSILEWKEDFVCIGYLIQIWSIELSICKHGIVFNPFYKLVVSGLGA